MKSESISCPICESEIDAYSDTTPVDKSIGCCMYCGFGYRTIAEQIDLKQLNEIRAEYNNKHYLKDEDKLEPLTQKDLNTHKDDIEFLRKTNFADIY
jgi:hypothetical protein